MLFQGLGQVGYGVGSLISAPLNIASGLMKTAMGAALLPFQMLGGLFGAANQALMGGAQMAMMPFLRGF